MDTWDHNFCRYFLSLVMKDVRKHVSKEDIKKSWGWKFQKGQYEFHGPEQFYWNGKACCMWHAKTNGWESYLRHKGIEVVEE